MHKEDISVQLYTTRKFQPYAPILNFIREQGLINLELFGLLRKFFRKMFVSFAILLSLVFIFF